MTKTIHFNTGRKYTSEGQAITATLHDDNMVTFMDHSRGVDGAFALNDGATFGQAEIMWQYDNCNAPSTIRSFQDGNLSGGCNTQNLVTDTMETEARELIAAAELDLGHLSDGQRRDLLTDNTEWDTSAIWRIVERIGD